MTDVTPTLHVAFYAHERDSQPRRAELTWDALKSRLHTPTVTACDPCDNAHDCPSKRGESWSPVELHATCQVGPSCKDPRHKRDPDHEAHRANRNVLSVQALVLDFDGLEFAGTRATLKALRPYTYLLHSTHSHRAPKQALRAVVALSRPVLGREWPAFVLAAHTMFGAKPDPACKDPSRLYYLPTVPASRAPSFMRSEGDGEPLDVDAVLAAAPPVKHAPEPSAPTGETVAFVPDRSISFEAAWQAVKTQRTTYIRQKDGRADLLGRIIEHAPLAERGGRDHALNQAMSILATCMPAGTPPEVAVEVVRRSVGLMADPEGLDHWLAEATDCYTRAAVRRTHNDLARARAALVNENFASAILRLVPRGRMTDAEKQVADEVAKSSGEEAPAEEEPAEDDWRNGLLWKETKNGVRVLLPHTVNIQLILQNDPTWKGTIVWNDLTRQTEVIGGPIPEALHDPNSFPQAVANYFMQAYGMDVTDLQVRKIVLNVSFLNKIDPLRDYLQGLTWDGVPRASRLLLDYCHADPMLDGVDLTAILGQTAKQWLISAVARALDPGCKVDTVLVLEGRMGRHKSEFFKELGGGFYTVGHVDLANKDTMMVAQRTWIIELAELAALNAASRESTNAFLTTATDTFRPPYGAAVTESKRRCVFVGTTEDDDWLQSEKGIRRYWPVKVSERIDLARVKADRDQLWAEAVALYKAGERWWFTEEEEMLAATVAKSRVYTSAVFEAVGMWWRGIRPEKRPTKVTINDVAQAALMLSPDKITPKHGRDIGRALRDMGFEVGPREVIGTHRVQTFLSTEPLRVLPVVTTNGIGVSLARIAGAKS